MKNKQPSTLLNFKEKLKLKAFYIFKAPYEYIIMMNARSKYIREIVRRIMKGKRYFKNQKKIKVY